MKRADPRKKKFKRAASDAVRPSSPPPQSPVANAGDPGKATPEEMEETTEKASALVQSQRKSVDSLTYIRRRVEENFPASAAAESLANQGYFIYDGFLCPDSNSDESGKDTKFGDNLLNEMFAEGVTMLSNDKLERDITRLGDGKFVGLIIGGEKYIDCPRLTEFVVSMTRHLPPLLNKIDTTLSQLDATASMGSLRMYDRKTKLGTESFLASKDSDDNAVDRPFGVICSNEDGANDSRYVTAMLFLSSKNWDSSTCGGGVTLESGKVTRAVRDRLVLLRSDTCSHRRDPWKGNDDDDLQQAGYVMIHFVKQR